MATDYNSKYSGEQVEALLDQVASGNAGGGGGGITVETDPVFSASPAATITEEKIAEWDSKSAQGEKGDKGDTGPQGPQGIQGEQGPKGEDGEDGVGIASVKQTTTSSADGGSNVVTVTLTNGTTSTFTVKNGSKGSSGSNGTNGTNGKDGVDGEDGATFTPSVDSAGNLSWTNDKGLTNPPTVNIKGPKGDKGDSGEGGGSNSGGKEVVVTSYLGAISPHTIYVLNWGIDHVYIESFVTSSAPYETYDIIFKSSEMMLGGDFSITLPSNVWWANGIVPTVEADTLYEFSIVKTTIENIDYFKAVLTPFKPA